MGLEDITEKVKKNHSSSSSDTSQGNNRNPRKGVSDESEYAVVVGKPPKQKAFTEDQWDDVKEVLMNEMDLNPNKVLNMPSEERYEILHEAALYSKGDIEDSEHIPQRECDYCGNKLKEDTDVGIEIADSLFCVHHTVGQIKNALD